MKDKKLSNKIGSSNCKYADFNVRMFAAVIDIFALTFFITPAVNLLKYIFFKEKTAEIVISDFFSIAQQNASAWNFVVYLINSFKVGFIVTQLITFLLIASILFWFWRKYNASIGKIIMRCRIIDAKTCQTPSIKQYILRLLGYIVSCTPPFLGLFMISFNNKSRGLHDYIAGTSVIYIEQYENIQDKVRDFI